MSSEHVSLAEIVGPWQEPAAESGLVDRVRRAWRKPIGSLTNHELATCLRQGIAVEQLLPIAKKRVDDGIEDGSEIDDDELSSAIADSEFAAKRAQEHKRIIAEGFRSEEKPA